MPGTVRRVTDTPTTGWSSVDRYLTRDRLVVYPAAIVTLFGAFWVASFWFVAPLPDFVARWTAGHLVGDGQGSSLYDPAVQSTIQEGLGSDALSWFVSPPYVAVLMVPFGLLPYPLAAALWTLLTFGLLWFSVRTLATLDPAFGRLAAWRGMLVAGSCQVVLELLGAGQDSAVVLAAFALGARLLVAGRDPWAGLVLSVALIKPQLVWLVPLVLLARRALAALAGFVVGAGILVGASLAVLGTDAWTSWLAALSSPLYRQEVLVGQTAKNTSVEGLVEHLVPGSGWPATALWAASALVVAVLTLRHRTTLRDLSLPVLLLTAVPLVTVLLSPHAMVYDLVLVYPAVAWLLTERPGPDVRGLIAVGYVLLFLSPLLQVVAREVPSTAVIAAPWVVLVLIALWWRLIHRQRVGAASST